MMAGDASAFSPHNHRQCQQQALSDARAMCAEGRVRLTRLREKVLLLVWDSHRPIGAYAIMDMLAASETRQVAPPTVYRALDFLLAHGLIHKIESLNAFVGCSAVEEAGHCRQFLICQCCGQAQECNDTDLSTGLQQLSAANEFEVQRQTVEILGRCRHCKAKNEVGQAVPKTEHEKKGKVVDSHG